VALGLLYPLDEFEKPIGSEGGDDQSCLNGEKGISGKDKIVLNHLNH
jgi:hypothetical protein